MDQCTNMKLSEFLNQGKVQEIEINNNYHNTPLFNSQTRTNAITNAIPNKNDIAIEMDHPNQIIHDYSNNLRQSLNPQFQPHQNIMPSNQQYIRPQQQQQYQSQNPQYQNPQYTPYSQYPPIQYQPSYQPQLYQPSQYQNTNYPPQYIDDHQYKNQYNNKPPIINEEGKSEYVEFMTKSGKKVKFIPKKKNPPKKADIKKKDDKVINEQVNVETIPIKPE
jgi:hypothetical protein